MFEKIISTLAGFIIAVISKTGYLGMMFLMAIESACIPLPSEIIMPFAGYLVYSGHSDPLTHLPFNLFMVATAGAIGCNLGSVIAYEIGCYGGRPLVERYGSYIFLGRHELEMAERFFQRFGAAAVLIGRLLPVIRTFIALARWCRKDAAPALPHFYIYRLLAVVLRAGLDRNEAGRALGQGPAPEAVVPPAGRGDYYVAPGRRHVVCVVALEGTSEGCGVKLDQGRSFDSSSASLGVAQDFAAGSGAWNRSFASSEEPEQKTLHGAAEFPD